MPKIELDTDEIEYLKRFIEQSDPFDTIKHAEDELAHYSKQLEHAIETVKIAKERLDKLVKRDSFIEKLKEKFKS